MQRSAACLQFCLPCATAPGEEIIPELHFGPNGLRGTLKAGEEYRAVLHPEYSWNILVTLALTPVDGRTDEEGVQVLFNGEKKNLVRIEEGNAEDSGIVLRFEAYAAKDSEYIISVTAGPGTDRRETAGTGKRTGTGKRAGTRRRER